jgi:hypothetical protein
MARFEKISQSVLEADKKFVAYLRGASISPANRGGTFVGNREVAPEEFRKYGIILPKGGIILPDIEKDKLEGIIKLVPNEEEERKKQEEEEILLQKKNLRDIFVKNNSLEIIEIFKKCKADYLNFFHDERGISLLCDGKYHKENIFLEHIEELLGLNLGPLPLAEDIANRKIVGIDMRGDFYPLEKIKTLKNDLVEMIELAKKTDKEGEEIIKGIDIKNVLVYAPANVITIDSIVNGKKEISFSSIQKTREIEKVIEEKGAYGYLEAKIADGLVSGLRPEKRKGKIYWDEGPKLSGAHPGGSYEGDVWYLGDTIIDTQERWGYDGKWENETVKKLLNRLEKGEDISRK